MDNTATTLVGEGALVEQALTDPAAFAPIYDYYFPRVYNYVRYRLRDAGATDDLTALIFERVFLKLTAIVPNKPLSARGCLLSRATQWVIISAPKNAVIGCHWKSCTNTQAMSYRRKQSPKIMRNSFYYSRLYPVWNTANEI